MEYLYHGSKIGGLKILEPHESTHGTYVYATPNEALAVIFSGKNASDLVQAISRHGHEEPYNIVERVPGAFAKMYDGSSSIYTIPADNFEDIKTGFTELVSSSPVEVISEEKIPRIYEKLKELEKDGKIKIYRYPNRPDYIPEDDTDLLEKTIRYASDPITREDFTHLLLLHPNLLDKVNEYCLSQNGGFTPFSKMDLLSIYDAFLTRSLENPNKEYFLDSAKAMILKYYPELAEPLEEISTKISKKN